MITLDCETCGLHGAMVLLQYAYDDGPIQLYCPWEFTVRKTLDLLEEIADNDVCGFNLTFDWFHIQKLYNCFSLLPLDKNPSPEAMASIEREARDGVCIKPRSACDIMLWARKTHYQTLLDRKDIRIRRIPTALAQPLADELERRIQLNPIYFGRRKKKGQPQWQVFDIEDETEFKDVVLKFAPTTALKALAVDALGLKNVAVYADVDLGSNYWPEEYGYAPFADAIPESNRTWPYLIRAHIEHWTTNEEARLYASNDVDYTRRLYTYFGSPEFGDDDSELACMVASCRWRGYSINVPGIKKLREKAIKRAGTAPTATRDVRKWLTETMSPTELTIYEDETGGSTKKILLQGISKQMKKACPLCRTSGRMNYIEPIEFVYSSNPNPLQKPNIKQTNCSECNGTGFVEHDACARAKAVLDAREAALEVNMYDKLLLAGRFHADFKIIGTLSSRMSGSGGLNAQGINSAKRVRRNFPLAFSPLDTLNGGDFSAFEIVLAIAAWGDAKLEETVQSYRDCHKCHGSGQSYDCPKCKGKGTLTKETEDYEEYQEQCPNCFGTGNLPVETDCYNCKGSGKVKTKIHALFGTYLYEGMTYEQILESDGANEDYYVRAKSMLFALLYGAEAYTLANRGGLDTETAEAGYQRFISDFPEIGKARRAIFDRFGTMKQHGGIGSKIEWADPDDFIEEPVTGHRRYFTLENRIAKTLYLLANNPPKPWLKLKVKVMRRDRVQTMTGAIQSALYACAFQIQGQVCRAASNHTIQASGAKITKRTQRRIWDIQPYGVNEWVVQPMNVHDELQVPTRPGYSKIVTKAVKDAVESFRDKVPLLAIDWFEDIPDWSGKKGL